MFNTAIAMKHIDNELIQNGDLCIFVCLDEVGQKETHHGIYMVVDAIPGMFAIIPKSTACFVFDLGSNSVRALEDITILGYYRSSKVHAVFHITS